MSEATPKKLQKEVRRIVGEFSHAMKSSLQGVVNIAEEMEHLASSRPPAADLAERCTEWSASLIDKCFAIRLLASNYSLAEADTKIARRVDDVLIQDLCRSVADHYHTAAKRRALRLLLNMPEDEPQVTSGDPELLEAAISNLIDNAIKYSFPKTDITIAYEVVPDQVDISVSNIGLGLHEAEKRRIFQLYQRGENARGRYVPGSGIGLYAVQRIAKQHGGSIRCDSRLLGGGGEPRSLVRFTLRLPTKQGEAR